MFANRIDRIQPSATLEMTAKAAELRQKGLDVINLSVGEPDFNTPKNIIEKAKKAMDEGYTKYTPGAGILELRAAICNKLERDNNLLYKPDEVIVSNGGKHSLYNACQVLFQSGDEVIIFNPYWVSFPDFVSVTGAKPVFVSTNSEKQFEPIFDELEKKINNNTKGIIINSPSNPTGGVWSDEAVTKTLEIANEHNLWVFSDECYEQLSYDHHFVSTATLAKKKEKIITFQSCSKTYAMTGWRIGYAVCDSKLAKAMSKLQGQSTSCPNSIAQHAAIEALMGDQESVNKMRQIFKQRRKLIVSRRNELSGITCKMPGGAFYVFPSIKNYLGCTFEKNVVKSGSDFSLLLLEKESVVTVAGDSFGAPEHIRLSYAASEEDINDAIDKIGLLLKKFD